MPNPDVDPLEAIMLAVIAQSERPLTREEIIARVERILREGGDPTGRPPTRQTKPHDQPPPTDLKTAAGWQPRGGSSACAERLPSQSSTGRVEFSSVLKRQRSSSGTSSGMLRLSPTPL